MISVLEFAIQKGSLHEMLDMVRLLLTLWTLGRDRQDNRSGSGKIESSAPLIPFLRRMEAIEPQKEIPDEDNIECDLNDTEDEPFVSATEAFLRYLEYPEDDTFNVDLQQCAVIIMSHLDRLATPIQPKLDPNFDFGDQKRQQSLIWAGQVSWSMFMDHSLGLYGL